MPDQRDVQQLIQSLTPSAVNNGNPNTVYNQPQPQGGYIPPTYDAGTNTWRINPAPAPSAVNWQQMSASQPQSWGWQQPAQPTPVPPSGPMPTTPTTPIPTTPVVPPPTAPVGGGGAVPGAGGSTDGAWEYGRGEGCVVVDTYLQDYDRADAVQVGDEMFVVDPISYKKSVGRVSYSETKLMPCVRITTENGIVLDCSTTAPIADERGEQVLAPDLLHKLIPVCDNGMFYLDRVETIEDIGEQEVRHITVEDNFFLAGKEKGRYIFHHNVKMIPGSSVDLIGMMDSLNNQFGWSNNSGGFGAESMGGGAPNTRGAMQANGSWDIAHGGTLSNPATSWGEAQLNNSNNNYTPTGQGLVDAFGGSLLPSGDTAWDLANNSGRPDPSLRWKQYLAPAQPSIGPNDVGYLFQSPVQYPDRNSGGSSQLGQGIYDAFGNAPSGATNNSGYMNSAWGGVGNSNVDTWDTSWMQPAPGADGGNGMYDWKSTASEANDTGGFWDKVVNWADNNIAGNMYDETTNSWNKGNIGWGVLTAITGLPFDDVAQRVSINSMMKGEGAGADYARAQTQQVYDRSNPAQREAMVTSLAEQYKKTPQEVLQIIGRMR